MKKKPKKKKKKNPLKSWYNEYCYYETQWEKRAAKRYLKLWKIFFMKKFPKSLVLDEEKWVINEKNKFVALKICLKRKRRAKKAKRGLKKIGISPLWYDDIPYNRDGWADAKKYTPDNFDLVKLDTGKRIVEGWYTGDEWYGLRLKSTEDVILWKKNEIE